MDTISPVNGLELLGALSPKLEEDILLALRFCYYVKHRPIVPDNRYDEAERAFLSNPDAPENSRLMEPGSDNANDYPENVRALAFYLFLTREAEKPEFGLSQ